MLSFKIIISVSKKSNKLKDKMISYLTELSKDNSWRVRSTFASTLADVIHKYLFLDKQRSRVRR